MKRCFKCKLVLPLSKFYPHPQMADGHLNKCKVCAKRDVAMHRVKNLDKIRAYDRERSHAPERIARTVEGNRARRMKNPIPFIARGKLSHAVKLGLVVRKPCVVCGNPKSHGHHEDYSKPLDVVWLCPLHHSARHAELARKRA